VCICLCPHMCYSVAYVSVHMCIYTYSHYQGRILLPVHTRVMCDMTHSCVCHDSFICVPWLMYMCHDSCTCVPWLVHTCHDSFTCIMTHSHLPWLIRMYYRIESLLPVLHQYISLTSIYLIDMCHDSFTFAMTHSHILFVTYMCHDSFKCAMTHSHTVYAKIPYTYSIWDRVPSARVAFHSQRRSDFKYLNLQIYQFSW